jgi:hypothetical protein
MMAKPQLHVGSTKGKDSSLFFSLEKQIILEQQRTLKY